MASRAELHNKFVEILGSRNVYFQPPETLKMNYPAIVYSFNGYGEIKADDMNYLLPKEYSVVLIHPDPDNKIVDEIMTKMKMCKFDRTMEINRLHHYYFKLFY